MRLPGGFSPVEAIKQAGSYVNPTGGVADYDVFSDVSFQGGVREPTETQGGLVSWGPQGQVKGTYQEGDWGGYNERSSQTGNNTQNTGEAGGDSGRGSVAVEKDPYAKWGGEENFNALQDQYRQSAQGYRSGAQTSLRDVKNEYGQKSRNFTNQIKDSQSEINREKANNQLNLRQSMQNIIRGLQTGIRSGGVALAGMNAMDSGAAKALARAYSEVGNQQTGEARGLAADEFAELQRSQGALDRTREEGLSDLDVWADTETQRVESDLSNKLQTLEAQARAEGLNGVVNTDMVDKVVSDAIAQLAQIDQTRTQGLSGVNAWSPDRVMQEALQLEQAGQVGNPFSVTAPNVSYGQGNAPLRGAPLGRLPIYAKGKDELGIVPTRAVRDDKERAIA